MEPSESTKQAAHEIMLYAERCRPGRMNQFTVEEIIQRAMNPDPDTNPTPEPDDLSFDEVMEDAPCDRTEACPCRICKIYRFGMSTHLP